MSNAIVGMSFSNPVNILQQAKSSKLTTNPFIPNEQRTFEIETIQQEANKIVEEAYKINQQSSIKNMSLADINKNISKSVIDVLDDLFIKPDDVTWLKYIPMILYKEQRYAYIGILLIFVALIYMFFRN